MVTVLGNPDRVTAHNRRTMPEQDSFADNQLAVYDYASAIATIRCNHLDPFGFPRRHFNVVGTQGTFQINPLEPPQVRIALDRPRGQFKKGFQDVGLPKSSGRYDDEFRDLAKVIRGEKKLEWDSKHDLDVHEAVLLGSGMPLD
jgi:predicted dehydrogenase